MKKTLKIFNFVIAGCAIAAFAITVVGVLIEPILFFSSILSSDELFPAYIMDIFFFFGMIPFAAILLKHAINLIKKGKTDDIRGSLKLISGIFVSILGIFTMKCASSSVYEVVYDSVFFEYIDVNSFIPLFIGIMLLTFPKSFEAYIKRNEFYRRSIFNASLGLVIFIYAVSTYGTGLFAKGFNSFGNVLFILILLSCIAYSVISIIYYFNNRLEFDDIEENPKNYTVIKEINNEIKKIKVTQKSADKGYVAPMVLYIIATAIFFLYVLILFITSRTIPHYIYLDDFSPESIGQLFNIAIFVGMFGLIPFAILGLLSFVTKESIFYKSFMSLSVAGTMLVFALVNNVFIGFDSFTSLIINSTSTISSDDIIAIYFINIFTYVPLIAVFVLAIVSRSSFMRVENNVKNGTSYYSNIKDAKRTNILYFVSTAIIVFSIMISSALQGRIDFAPMLLFVCSLLIMIATILHEKHPLEESYVVNMKSTDQTTSVVEEEYAEAVIIEDDEPISK